MLNKSMFLESYEDFDQEVLNEIILMFIEDYKLALKNMDQAIFDGNSAILAQVANKYKGTVSAMYDMDLRDLAQKMEQMAKNGQMEGVEILLEEISVLSNKLAIDLKELVK